MNLRRMIGLVAALSVLQVNAKVAFAACESVASAAPASEMADGHPAGHDHGSPPNSEQGGAPADTPLPIACCQAMTSCGAVLDLGDATEVATHGLTAELAIGAIQRTPLSRITAPEPPPPKA